MTTTTDDRKRELLRLIERASRYGQTAFVRTYEAELRALPHD